MSTYRSLQFRLVTIQFNHDLFQEHWSDREETAEGKSC